LRSSTSVVFCAIDNLISPTGKPLTGFPQFLESLAEASVPCVWVTSRTRSQLDAALRKLGHSEPFIAEGGSGVYLPEDYFHLRPTTTMRLGRFTCIPVASPQPAAAEALDLLAEQTGISVVSMRALSPRELSQNTGLPQREAELLRLRDFDELFFFAGASDADIAEFQAEATRKKLTLRLRGVFWALAVGASLSTCTRELCKLYDRSLRAHAFNVAIATSEEAPDLFPACEHAILLADRSSAPDSAFDIAPRSIRPASRPAPKSFPLFSPNTWELLLDTILNRRF
jgi:predicted mannosyl-3-phosphoglycerate phosphatase (HAD superfamily)